MIINIEGGVGVQKEQAHFVKFLTEKKLKYTGPRKKILQAFLNTEKHVGADELCDLCKKQDSRIGAATVYRTLKLIRDAGLAREVDFGEGKKRYEHLFGHEHHDHLVCIRCGKFTEFLDPQIEKMQIALSKRYRFKLLWHRMEFFGLCRNCL